jgi:hypothetical protein
MKARIVREELQKCHKAEGVNHYQVCNDLTKRYMELLKEAKVCKIGCSFQKQAKTNRGGKATCTDISSCVPPGARLQDSGDLI